MHVDMYVASMYVCMCVCMHACMYACIYVSTHILVHLVIVNTLEQSCTLDMSVIVKCIIIIIKFTVRIPIWEIGSCLVLKVDRGTLVILVHFYQTTSYNIPVGFVVL